MAIRRAISPLLTAAAMLAVSGLAAACVPTPPPLRCSAIASAALPPQFSNETITVRAVAAARVLTVAQFKTIALSKATSTNALGFSNTVYNIGAATPGVRVTVTALVVKGRQKGTCTTSFTPVRKVGVAPLPPTPGAPLPDAPLVTRTAQITGSIALAWSEADGNGLPVTGWKVSRDGVDTYGTGAWSTVLPASANQFRFHVLVFAKSYTVSVAAITAAGVGPATSRTLSDDNKYTLIGAPCDNAGERTASFRGYGVCDGFEFIPFGRIAVYNVTAQRLNGGVVIGYTAESPPGYQYPGLWLTSASISVSGSLSQLGAVTRSFDDPYSSVTGPVTKYQYVPGSFSGGRATLTVNGLSYYYAPIHSSEVIGVDIA